MAQVQVVLLSTLIGGVGGCARGLGILDDKPPGTFTAILVNTAYGMTLGGGIGLVAGGLENFTIPSLKWFITHRDMVRM